jgi:hypothetical protein
MATKRAADLEAGNRITWGTGADQATNMIVDEVVVTAAGELVLRCRIAGSGESFIATPRPDHEVEVPGW